MTDKMADSITESDQQRSSHAQCENNEECNDIIAEELKDRYIGVKVLLPQHGKLLGLTLIPK